jgi:hypothetical protein
MYVFRVLKVGHPTPGSTTGHIPDFRSIPAIVCVPRSRHSGQRAKNALKIWSRTHLVIKKLDSAHHGGKLFR